MSIAWIDLETAAKRSGKSVGHLARTAANKWRSEGKAELRQPAEGGKPRWQIREDADAAFAMIKTPDQIGVDLRQYTAKQRERAWQREKILKEWDEYCRICFKIGFDRVRATNTFVERLLTERNVRVSIRTLYNWHNAYRAGGIAGLIDGRSGGSDIAKDGNAAPAIDPFLAEVQRLYLTVRQLKLTSCRNIALATAMEKGWVVRSYKKCQRHIDKIPAGVITKMRGGEDAYVAKAETYIERDYTTIDSNDWWCADHHQMDVIVQAGGKLLRPWLSVFQDVRSRKIMAWAIVDHAPNADLILNIFRAGVQDFGAPYHLIIDNGKDYDCYALNGRTKKDRFVRTRIKIQMPPERSAGIFPQLGVQVHHAWTFHGQSKPVEPWFKNPEEANRTWDTYCGNKPANRPEDLQVNLERGKAPRIEDYTAWFADWLSAFEASHQHTGDGMDGRTPDAVYAACFVKSKRIAPPDLLDLFCLKVIGKTVNKDGEVTDRIKVGRNGVRWNGLHFGQHEPALHRLLGTEVVLRVDERFAGHVQVYTLTDQFICIAQSNVKLPWGADAQDLREAIASKKQDRNLIKTFVDRRSRLADDLPDRLVRAAAARAAAVAAENPQPLTPGPTLLPIQHALADQLPALQRALEANSNDQRIAVGGESTTVIDLGKTFSRESEQPSAADPFDLLMQKFRSDHE